MNRCADRHCNHVVSAGEIYCHQHQRAADDDGLTGPERAAQAHAVFRARLAAGDYDALLGPGLRDVLQQASEAGLEAEIGMMRVAMARLLQEERDSSRMAHGVARVAGVLVQAARLRQGGAETEAIRELIQQRLVDFEAGLIDPLDAPDSHGKNDEE